MEWPIFTEKANCRFHLGFSKNIQKIFGILASVFGAAFHLERNLLPEGNFGLWKEIAFRRKLGGYIVIRREMKSKISKNAVNAVMENLKQDHKSPYIKKLSTQPRTQGIISQTLLSVDRKDPRASWYVSRGEMQEIVMESLFNFTPTASSPHLATRS